MYCFIIAVRNPKGSHNGPDLIKEIAVERMVVLKPVWVLEVHVIYLCLTVLLNNNVRLYQLQKARKYPEE